MFKLQAFKKDLNQAIEQFSKDHMPLSISEMNHIAKLKQVIQQAQSAAVLRHDIEQTLPKLPGRTWAFLPLVANLRKALQAVLHDPRYQPMPLMIEECNALRSENREWQKKADDFMQSGITEMQGKIKGLEQTIASLEEQLQHERHNFAEAQQLHAIEKQRLDQEITLLQEQNLSLKSQNTGLQTQKEELYNKYLEQLARVEELEAKLSEEKEKNKTASGKEGASTLAKLTDYRRFFSPQ